MKAYHGFAVLKMMGPQSARRGLRGHTGRQVRGRRALRRHAPAEGAAPLSKGRDADGGFCGAATRFAGGWGAGPPSARLRGARPGMCRARLCGLVFLPAAAHLRCCSYRMNNNTARLCFPTAVYACAAMRCQCGVRDDAFSLSGGSSPDALYSRAASPAACACRTSLFPGCGAPAPACAGQGCAASFPSRTGTSLRRSHAANTARLCFPPAVHACAAMRCQCGVRGDGTGAALRPAAGLVRRVLPRRRVAFQ